MALTRARSAMLIHRRENRTIDARLRECPSLLDWDDVDRTGAADCSAVLATAVAEALSTSGVLVLPKGEYRLSQRVTIAPTNPQHNRFSLIGMPGAVIRYDTGHGALLFDGTTLRNSESAFKFATADHLLFRPFDGQSAGGAAVVSFVACNEARYEDCEIWGHDLTGIGVLYDSTWQATHRNGYIDSCGFGVQIQNNSNGIHVHNNEIALCTRAGIYVPASNQGCDANIIAHNYIERNGSGSGGAAIALNSPNDQGWVIIANYINDNGWPLPGDYDILTVGNETMIVANSFDSSNNTNAIKVEGDQALISVNHFSGPFTYGSDAVVRLHTGADVCVVTNNNFTSKPSGGVEIIDASSNKLNMIRGNKGVDVEIISNLPVLRAGKPSGGDQPVSNDTWTKVSFTEVHRQGGAFASSAWTPGMKGFVQINASVYYLSMGENAVIGIRILRNGSLIEKESYNVTGFNVASGVHGVNISATLYCSSYTDYYEIWTIHGGGTDRYIANWYAATNFEGFMIE